jgi:hypothetical protein
MEISSAVTIGGESKMSNIRRAEIYESEILTTIAALSEAYWGYDMNFMESLSLFIR